MRLRTFTAPDMPAAMRLVREALGDHAIILTSEADKGRGVRITAAVEEDAPETPQPVVRVAAPVRQTHIDPAADRLRFEIQNILRFHNLPELFIAKMLQKASDADLSSILALHGAGRNRDANHLFRLALEKLLGNFFTFLPLRPDMPGLRLMLAGPPGAGKTLTIAKLATKLSMDGHSPAIITTDNKRAGGVEQLQAFTTILGIKLTVAASSDALHEQVKALPARTPVLVDMAGCNPYDKAELQELKAYAAACAIEPVLVLPAGGDSLEAIDMVEAYGNALPVKRLLVTHTDMARRFGGVLAAASAHGLAFCHASGSASIADGLQAVDGAWLAQLLLRYR